MKVRLMYPDRAFDPETELPPHVPDLRQDLELDRLLSVMARDDDYLYTVCERGLFNGVTEPDVIRYRQGALRDCLAHPGTVIEIYNLVFEALAQERKHWLFRSAMYQPTPDKLLTRALSLLTVFLDALVRVRDLTAAHRAEFDSAAFTQLFATLARELSDDYIAEVRDHLAQCRFPRGAHFSARLERGCSSTDYILRTPHRVGLLGQLGQLGSADSKSYTFRVADRDIAAMDAAAELYARGIMAVSQTLTRASDHVTAFLRQLRAELGFYIGCYHLRRELDDRRLPVCFPEPVDIGTETLTCRGLYDPCLGLHVGHPVIGNDVDADGISVIVVTGANQGGKSTFLRSVGAAQLMMQAGMFVPAESFRANTRTGVFTHFKREEDQTMTHGKFDEELVRMSHLIDLMGGDALLLCNESFAATNEREGSAIARDVIDALDSAGVEIVYVTHMFDLASSLARRHDATQLFLRAERRRDGARTLRVTPGAPLPTSHGDDVYRRVFGTEPEAAPPNPMPNSRR
ncbi:MutS-related protein [Nocardia nova]|uniref:MutS-related protein n=1 Tax=Nocardia nova TaxID=37330 RepID=UPI0033CE6630